ncbi:hypothetical protein ABH15_00110 [Methanoculleus taiwanensis]|uniref:Methyltransferase domain-containing protein n=1 Tax=Methanoculleus taiwanensis TaxID=1550565 RepID=A0A498H113_9EURY|nr:class I SAM-dependent methyltransferase [Methanoculleus taiwanensis]RXE56631.1 hypothetical protein ABH15_00110 [Methanoculleus taiwanensis]
MHISRLPETTKAPRLYEKGTASMWEDDHISGHLLKMHLHPEIDAASRRGTAIRKTVQWIESHLHGGERRILDLGCGPGLYCEMLAEAGHWVTGVDFSERSIAYARQEAARKELAIEYLHQNYLDLAFEDRFDLAMMIYCDFDVLIPEDRDRLLQNIYRALRPGGLFIFDTLNAKAPERMKVPGRSWETAESGFWKDEPYLALSETFHYDEANVILQQHVVCSEADGEAVYRFWTHYYGPETLTSILEGQGFSEVAFYESPFPDGGDGASEMVTFVAARRM